MATADIKGLVREALYASRSLSGKKEVRKNRFGDYAMLADIQAEKLVIDKLQGLPLRFVSEEHGIFDNCKNPQYLAILDGLDGSYNFKNNTGKYGTMLAILKGLEPRYDDYITGGIMEHTTGTLVTGGMVSGNIDFSDKPKYIDNHYEINVKTFSSLDNLQCLNASCIHYMELIQGRADLVLECTRKNNLEIAVAYGLVKDSGGVFVTLDGKSLGRKKYQEFGKEHIPVIAASSMELANKVIHLV